MFGEVFSTTHNKKVNEYNFQVPECLIINPQYTKEQKDNFIIDLLKNYQKELDNSNETELIEENRFLIDQVLNGGGQNIFNEDF